MAARRVDWLAVSVGAVFATVGMLVIPAAAHRLFRGSASLGPTAATMDDVQVWLPAFFLPLVIVAAATAAFTRKGSPVACGIAAGVVGYWVCPALVFIVRHASEHECGTETGCTSTGYLLMEGIVLAALGTVLVAVAAAVGATFGAALNRRVDSHGHTKLDARA